MLLEFYYFYHLSFIIAFINPVQYSLTKDKLIIILRTLRRPVKHKLSWNISQAAKCGAVAPDLKKKKTAQHRH